MFLRMLFNAAGADADPTANRSRNTNADPTLTLSVTQIINLT